MTGATVICCASVNRCTGLQSQNLVFLNNYYYIRANDMPIEAEKQISRL